MKFRTLCSALTSIAFAITVAAEELTLRPLGPAVDRYLAAKTPDMEALSYICARGAALYTAYAGTVQGTATNDREKQHAAELQKKALPYYQVAMMAAAAAKKDAEATPREIVTLVETYARMMARSRQLNDEIVSAPVRKDIDALKAVEKLVIRFAAELDGTAPR